MPLVKIFGASFLLPTSNVPPASRVLGGEERVGIQPLPVTAAIGQGAKESMLHMRMLISFLHHSSKGL